MTASAIIATFLLATLHYALCTSYEDLESFLANANGTLDFCDLAEINGYPCVRYDVTTEDGYILGVYNIPGNKSNPVYLQHGFVDSSYTFLVRQNSSWVAYLADKGYDVWLGNMRGNMLSREHVTLDPETLPFWEFSFHEIAIYDVSATIDFILNSTGQTQLQAIGHSEGTTVFFVLCSMKPEYNEKIKVVICLAPIAYLYHAQSPIFPLISVLGEPVSALLSVIAHGEFLSNSSVLAEALRFVCTQGLIGYEICDDVIFSALFGADPEQLEESFVQFVVNYYPGGSSLKNGAHLLQLVARRKFAQYDYGLENLSKYSALSPPEYNLTRVTCDLVFVVGLNDRLSDIEDVEILREELPKSVDYYVVEYEKWNHVDFVWGKYLPTYLYDYVYEKLNEYY